VCVLLTSNLLRALAPGNVRLDSRFTGLPKDSVANVSQIMTVDKRLLSSRVGMLPRAKLDLVLSGVGVILGK
jgi:mRNA interferase MazF